MRFGLRALAEECRKQVFGDSCHTPLSFRHFGLHLMTNSKDDEEKIKAELQAEWQARFDRLIVQRANAIDAYAGLERSLASLFSMLLDIDQDLATLVFYRIVNARSRNAMLQELITRKYGITYKRYWDSMFRFITKLDGKRNEIVHWHIGGIREPSLTHPKHFFWEDQSDDGVTINQIEDFICRAKFANCSIFVFSLLMSGAVSEADGQTAWRKTFLQPVAYPPPAAHPLSALTGGIPEKSQGFASV